MTADLRALLDGLDAAWGKATPGPWSPTDRSRALIVRPDGRTVGTAVPADVALIVAAVNALPKLTAALRAVLALDCTCGEPKGEHYPDCAVWAVRAAALATEAAS